jgi:hypothetical protein
MMMLVAGCESSATGPAESVTVTTPASVDPALLEPLTALGPCPSAPPGDSNAEPVEGLQLPEGTVVTNVTRTDPVVTVNAWVPLTPVQLREGFLQDPDLSVIQSEDEVWEAEVLFTRGDFRTFVKAQCASRRRS